MFVWDSALGFADTILAAVCHHLSAWDLWCSQSGCSSLTRAKGELTLQTRIISYPETQWKRPCRGKAGWSVCAAPCAAGRAGNGASTARAAPGSLPAPLPCCTPAQHSNISQPYFKSSSHSYHSGVLETEWTAGLLWHSQFCFSSPLLFGSSFLSLSPFVSLGQPSPNFLLHSFHHLLRSFSHYTAKRCCLPLTHIWSNY